MAERTLAAPSRRQQRFRANGKAHGARHTTDGIIHLAIIYRVFEGVGGRRALLSDLFFNPLTMSNAVTASRLTRNITVPGSLKTNAINALDNTTTAFADPVDSTVALNATSASPTSLASLDATEDSWIAPLVNPGDGSSQAVNVPWSIRGPRTMELKPPGFRKSLI